MRSKKLHEQWLNRLNCSVLRLENVIIGIYKKVIKSLRII